MRWPDDPQEYTVPSTSSAPTAASSSPPSLARRLWIFLAKHLGTWLPVLIITVYLLVRDGWFSLLAEHISSRTSRFATYRFLPPHTISPELLRQIDDRITLALKGPVLLRDYALLADGAIVDEELTTHTFTRPALALTDDNRIGNCWRIPAKHGQLGIMLPDFIRPTFVTVDHIPVELAADPGEAPSHIVLWGVVDGDRNERLLEDHRLLLQEDERHVPPYTGRTAANFVILANFTYDTVKGSSPVQTFPIRSIFREVALDFGLVIVEIVDNWGSASTCMYRVRVHGELSNSEG